MGMVKQVLFSNTEYFAKRYGNIFVSLYLYEYNQEYKISSDFPQQCDETSENIIKFVLSNYFTDILENYSYMNLEFICPIMLFDLLELYDY